MSCERMIISLPPTKSTPPGRRATAKPGVDVLLRLFGEVDDDVAAEDEVHVLADTGR